MNFSESEYFLKQKNDRVSRLLFGVKMFVRIVEKCVYRGGVFYALLGSPIVFPAVEDDVNLVFDAHCHVIMVGCSNRNFVGYLF